MSMLEELKLPPHNLEAEQSVIGGLLLDNNAIDRIVGILSESDFYRHDHQVIFSHIEKMIARNQPADIVTVAESMEAAGVLERVGGISYIGAMAQNTPGSANIKRYAEIVRDKAVARNLISIAAEIQEDLYSTADIQSSLDRAQSAIMGITERSTTSDPVAVRDLLPACADRIDAAFHGDIKCVKTGFDDLDNALGGGMEPGDLVILAGRPSMGKTALAIQIAEAIQRPEAAAFVVTCEMANGQIVMRLLSAKSRINSYKFRNGKMDNEDWTRLASGLGKLSEINMFVDDKTFTLSGVRSKARTIKRKHGLSVIIVDYIQLLKGEGTNREQEVSSISRGLKAIAKELEVPVIALSQLSRKVEDRADKRPLMSDLRESGAIEQDADVIAFVYRDEYYNQDSPYKGTAEVIIAKQRNGAIGRVVFTFVDEHTLFLPFAGQVYEFKKPAPKTRGFKDD
jgi:replicative DNA helicase